MVFPLSTPHLRGQGEALWEQQEHHGNQFLAGVTSAPHTCGLQFQMLSDIQNALVLHCASAGLSWLFSKVHKGHRQGGHNVIVKREPLPTLFFLLQEAEELSSIPEKEALKLQMNSHACLPYGACRHCY